MHFVSANTELERTVRECSWPNLRH